jgi:hypothetical protein
MRRWMPCGLYRALGDLVNLGSAASAVFLGPRESCFLVVVHFQSAMTLKIEKDSSLCSE